MWQLSLHCHLRPVPPVVFRFNRKAHKCTLHHLTKLIQIGQSAASYHDLTILNIRRNHAPCPETLRHCQHVHSGHVTASLQSTASYTAADVVTALKSCYQKSKKLENYPNIFNVGAVRHHFNHSAPSEAPSTSTLF